MARIFWIWIRCLVVVRRDNGNDCCNHFERRYFFARNYNKIIFSFCFQIEQDTNWNDGGLKLLLDRRIVACDIEICIVFFCFIHALIQGNAAIISLATEILLTNQRKKVEADFQAEAKQFSYYNFTMRSGSFFTWNVSLESIKNGIMWCEGCSQSESTKNKPKHILSHTQE